MRHQASRPSPRARARATWALGLALSAIAVAAAHAAPARGAGLGASPAQVKETLRRHPLRTMDGKTVSIASLEGQVVVVNFWATWCPPCRKELSKLDALHAELLPQGGRVLAIAIDLDPENVRRFVRKRGLKLQAVTDGPDGLARDLDLPHVPYTIVLDRSGNLVHQTSQSDDDAIAATAAVARRLVAERPLTSQSQAGQP